MMPVNSSIKLRLISGGLIAHLFITGLVSCSSEKTETQESEKFLVTSVSRKDTVYTREYVADIHSIQNTEIRAKTSGYLESIHVDEGQKVSVGQILFTLGGQQYQQELTKAQAALASTVAETKAAEVELGNTKALVEKNIVSKSELELAQAKYDALKAKIEEAKAHEAGASLQLAFSHIKAPFSGYINRIPNKTGSLISEGTLLTAISNNNEMLVYFNVSEKDYFDYAGSDEEGKSKSVSLVLANGAPYEYEGIIEATESEFDKSTGTIAFRARFPNPKHLLKHGSSGKVLMKIALKDALIIPQKSTFEIQDNIYVYVLTNDNTVQMKKITSSFRLPHLFVVSSGLSPQDKILLEGIQKVKDGDKIIPETVVSPAITNR